MGALAGVTVRDDGHGPALDQQRSKAVAVVAAVSQASLGWRKGCEQTWRGPMVADLSGGDGERDQAAQPIGYPMDFGARSAARASDGLRLCPPFPPAAERCALAVELSIACSPPGVTSTKAANRPCQMPRCDQR